MWWSLYVLASLNFFCAAPTIFSFEPKVFNLFPAGTKTINIFSQWLCPDSQAQVARQFFVSAAMDRLVTFAQHLTTPVSCTKFSQDCSIPKGGLDNFGLSGGE